MFKTILLIVASALFSTGALATGWSGGAEECSEFPLFKGGLSCNLYCGDGRYGTRLNCNEQREGDASSYCGKIKNIFLARHGGDLTEMPCEEVEPPPPIACPCTGEPYWDISVTELSAITTPGDKILLGTTTEGGYECIAPPPAMPFPTSEPDFYMGVYEVGSELPRCEGGSKDGAFGVKNLSNQDAVAACQAIITQACE